MACQGAQGLPTSLRCTQPPELTAAVEQTLPRHWKGSRTFKSGNKQDDVGQSSPEGLSVQGVLAPGSAPHHLLPRLP